MAELPENFPEFSIMYKTLTKQIKKLEESLDGKEGKEKEEIEEKIRNYNLEILKIKKKNDFVIFDNVKKLL